MSSPRLGDLIEVLDALYPRHWAEPWDAVGPVCGDPDDRVDRVLLAVDPTAQVVDEALGWGAQLLLTHHPLLLRGVHGVPASTPKGRIVHRLVRGGCALFTAHTNADVADPGVSDALARAVGLTGSLEPLQASAPEPLDKVVTFVPRDRADAVVDALSAAGAGAIGDYSRCAYLVDGTGTFLPGPGASPTIGAVGERARVAETRIEMVLPRDRRYAVVRALRAAHPYEEPAFDVVELDLPQEHRGLGRIGTLGRAVALVDLAGLVAAALPDTSWGVRAAGDPTRKVRRLAVCGGAGDSLLGAAAAAGVDAFLTADLRHHPASEHVEAAGPALLDAAHWATEWPWLDDAAARLEVALRERLGTTVSTRVSTVPTDPWTTCVSSPGQGDLADVPDRIVSPS